DDAAELLDPAFIAEVEAELQRTAPGRGARGREGVADLLRELGPLTAAEVAARTESTVPPEAAESSEHPSPSEDDGPADHLEERAAAGRTVVAERGGYVPPLWAAVGDAGRLRAVMGASAVRPGSPERAIPGECLAPGRDPLRDLVVRRTRTRGLGAAGGPPGRVGVGGAPHPPPPQRLGRGGTPHRTRAGLLHTDVFARIRRRA